MCCGCMSDEVAILACLLIDLLPRSTEISFAYVWAFLVVLIVCLCHMDLLGGLLAIAESIYVIIASNKIVRHWEVTRLIISCIQGGMAS